MGVFIFLRLMVNTLIFDVRDVEGDRAAGIRTVPAVYGADATYRIMASIDAMALAFLAASIGLGLLPTMAAILGLLPVYSLGYTILARRPKANLSFICVVLVDGEYLIWGPLMYLGAAIV